MAEEKPAAPPGLPVADPRLRAPNGSIGNQYDSKKETLPAFSFGTGTREVATKKVYISAQHEKGKPGVSPGPVYGVPTTVGAAPMFSFGAEERRHFKAQYPDTSVDLTCSTVDSQQVKFRNAPGMHFGTESRSCVANGELIRVNPPMVLGHESPGALEYNPERSEKKSKKQPPAFSFGPVIQKDAKKKQDAKKDPQKPSTRLHVPSTGTPRHVGPGSHLSAHSMGAQPQSARSSAPAYSFGGSPRLAELKKCGQLYDVSSDLSSLGKQVVSGQKSTPTCTFGDATRDKVARSQVVMTGADRGPVAQMPKPNFHCDLPKPPVGRPLARAGM